LIFIPELHCKQCNKISKTIHLQEFI